MELELDYSARSCLESVCERELRSQAKRLGKLFNTSIAKHEQNGIRRSRFPPESCAEKAELIHIASIRAELLETLIHT